MFDAKNFNHEPSRPTMEVPLKQPFTYVGATSTVKAQNSTVSQGTQEGNFGYQESRENSGDWANNPGAWNSVELETKNSEWKYKNLYSMPNADPRTYWNSGCANVGTELGSIERSRKEAKGHILANIREYLANYQESCGTPRTEYTFAALIWLMGEATGRSLLALLYVIINIVPIVEIFLYILRFALDKTIYMRGSKDFHQTMITYAIFFVQLSSVYICLTFIFGYIVLPIMHMVIDILWKVLLYK